MYREQENKKKDNQKKFHFDNVYMDNPRLYEPIFLLQIGDLSCDGGYVIQEHVQCCYEISYIAEGCGYYYSNGSPYRVKEGDVYLCQPGVLHYGIADKINPFRYFYAGFNFDNSCKEAEQFTHIIKMFDQVKNPVALDKFGIQTPFVNIFNELINLKDYAPLMLKTYLHQIIISAYRDFFDRWEKEYSPQGNLDETKKIVYDIINYIDVNLCKISELTQIANALDYSYYHLSHVFSREIGLTIKEYYNRKRFKKAVEWLKASDLNITQISKKLQYQSIHTFSKAFRNNFGISPTEYQALYKSHNK